MFLFDRIYWIYINAFWRTTCPNVTYDGSIPYILGFYLVWVPCTGFWERACSGSWDFYSYYGYPIILYLLWCESMLRADFGYWTRVVLFYKLATGFYFWITRVSKHMVKIRLKLLFMAMRLLTCIKNAKKVIYFLLSRFSISANMFLHFLLIP